jgi:DNA-binding LacI/PurR family transcriptional regulator
MKRFDMGSGSTTVTIGDVARSAGVAKSTASAALNGKEGKYGVSAEKREAVLLAAQRLGFEVNPHAQRLANGRCDTSISIVTPTMDLGVGTSKITAIQQLLLERGYDVSVHSYSLKQREEATAQATLMNQLRRQKPRAIICCTTSMQEDATLELKRYIDEGGIAVCYDQAQGYDAEIGCDRVVFDRAGNSYQAAKHLLELGHRKLGLFVNGVHTPGGERMEGFQKALKQYGGYTRDEWYFSGTFMYEEGGRSMAKQFLKLKERPTAICVVNDNAALAFIAEVQNAGIRVPQDVSVIGHDNLSFVPFGAVPLTAMSHPVKEIAHYVGNLLLDRAEGGYNGAIRQVILQGTLVVRQSTAPPQTA